MRTNTLDSKVRARYRKALRRAKTPELRASVRDKAMRENSETVQWVQSVDDFIKECTENPAWMNRVLQLLVKSQNSYVWSHSGIRCSISGNSSTGIAVDDPAVLD
jgi:hypothetical protein